MKNTWKKLSYRNLGIVIGITFAVLGASADAFAQRDPFYKPVIVPKKVAPPKPVVDPATVKPKIDKPAKPVPPAIVALSAPPVEMRVEQYKALKKLCAERGISCPKPTSVLMLEEIQVTGIFYTPRGYSAMVEATPIQLSYTVYPGEKFFNGQLVAIEENRLIFRKVTKLSNGKLVTVAENKGLRQDESNPLSAGVESTANKAKLPIQLASNGLGIMDLPLPVPEKPAGAPKTEGENPNDAAKPTGGKKKTAKYRTNTKTKASVNTPPEAGSGEPENTNMMPAESPAVSPTENPSEEPVKEKPAKPAKKGKSKPKK